MKATTTAYRLLTLLLTAVLVLGLLPVPTAEAKTVAEWLEGYKTGKDWFGDGYKYDITDEAWCWEQLMKPMTVLDVAENEDGHAAQRAGRQAGERRQAGRHHRGADIRDPCAGRG